ncbi:carboxypeptidase [Anaerofustis stercorihominis]|uniref:Carboxypeptidase n=1 Tax=Anaerofustis stercorihominis TaxID=214853 RepID=A0A3E3DUP9_9FIRM|nr:carboxypeptidase [Anaerofustis stercorihominis]RGD72943.1 carboxypeptidase [Anaerofustis stercorihominis]
MSVLSVKVRKVIEIKTDKGMGIKEDPIREVTQYWDLEGNLLAEKDCYCSNEENQ